MKERKAQTNVKIAQQRVLGSEVIGLTLLRLRRLLMFQRAARLIKRCQVREMNSSGGDGGGGGRRGLVERKSCRISKWHTWTLARSRAAELIVDLMNWEGGDKAPGGQWFEVPAGPHC